MQNVDVDDRAYAEGAPPRGKQYEATVMSDLSAAGLRPEEKTTHDTIVILGEVVDFILELGEEAHGAQSR